jgi:hypothetical protein
MTDNGFGDSGMELEKAQVREVSALESIQKAEATMAVETAKKYPRSVATAIRNATQLVTFSAEAAESCHYSMPRGNKMISGPSIRLAEVIACQWGNMRIQTHVLEIGERDVTVVAMGHDLESNLATSVETKRRIVDRNGRRYNDDMITLTCNAAASIAYRNVVFKLIPQALWQQVSNAALKKMRDGDRPIEDRRKHALAWFSERGISEKQVLQKLGLAKRDDILKDHIVTLQGIRNAVIDGNLTLANAFGIEPVEAPPPPPQPPQDVPYKPVETPPPPEPPQAEAPPPAPETPPMAPPEEAPPPAPDKKPLTVTPSNGADDQPAMDEEYKTIWNAWRQLVQQLTPEQKAWVKQKTNIQRVRLGTKIENLMLLCDAAEEALGQGQ